MLGEFSDNDDPERAQPEQFSSRFHLYLRRVDFMINMITPIGGGQFHAGHDRTVRHSCTEYVACVIGIGLSTRAAPVCWVMVELPEPVDLVMFCSSMQVYAGKGSQLLGPHIRLLFGQCRPLKMPKLTKPEMLVLGFWNSWRRG